MVPTISTTKKERLAGRINVDTDWPKVNLANKGAGTKNTTLYSCAHLMQSKNI